MCMECVKCGSKNVTMLQFNNTYEKTNFNGEMRNNNKKSEFMCLECDYIFKKHYKKQGISKALTVEIDFSIWTFEITGKPFLIRNKKAVNVKIFTAGGLTYFATAKGAKADMFLDDEVEDIMIGELRQDKFKNLKIWFNEDDEMI